MHISADDKWQIRCFSAETDNTYKDTGSPAAFRAVRESWREIVEGTYDQVDATFKLHFNSFDTPFKFSFLLKVEKYADSFLSS